MEEGTPLTGSCSCGRNHYIIYAPHPRQSLQLLFDERAEPSRVLSLRVPIAHIQSSTHAFYEDETHNTIRRVFTPPNSPHTKRHFCGFCGTQLSYWSEEPPEEAEFIFVNLGSLKNESMEKLGDAGILSEANDEEREILRGPQGQLHSAVAPIQTQGRELKGSPWFEEMIEGSELGRIRRKRGGESSANGKMTVEWEVLEFEGEEGDGGGTSAPKRKIGALNEDDVDMKNN